MGEFRYRALTTGGEIIEEVMDAPDRESVVSRLRSLDHVPISVDPAEPSQQRPFGVVARSRSARRPRVSTQSLAVFTRQLGTLLEAKLLLDDAFGVAVEAAETPAIAAVAVNLRQRVREGAPLSDALASHPHMFDEFYRAMVAAGERGGDIAASLSRLAGYIERSSQLSTAIRSAMIYPIILVAAALTSAIILMTIVLPQFESLFRSAAAELPILTQTMFTTARFLRDFGLVILLAALVLYLTGRHQWRENGMPQSVERVLLRVPVIGRLMNMVEFERVFRALAMLLVGNVGLSDALAQSARVARNRIVASAITETNEAIKAGSRLADALAGQSVVPRLSIHLIRVGETSGDLGQMLTQLADIYAGEVEIALKRLVVIVEPLLIILIGIFVAIIVLSLLSAIVGINAVTF